MSAVLVSRPRRLGENARLRASRRGFTLIELLVVIAIISILTGALLPALTMARGKARLATCMSNLKQIAVGMSLYSDAAGETLPVA